MRKRIWAVHSGRSRITWKRAVWWGLAGLLPLLIVLSLTPASDFNTPSVRAADPPATTLTTVASTVTQTTVDVVIYGTQTSGITAAHEIVTEDPHLRVAIISSGQYLESPLAQGLCVEDAREVSKIAGGAYEEWRRDVISYYQQRGEKPFTPSAGRFVYEPAVASGYLWALLENKLGTPIVFYPAKLVAASDSGPDRQVTVRMASGQLVTIHTSYFIDASVEADLARLLGASYRIGRDEKVYNDVGGRTPAYPSAANAYATAPQRLSVLLTFTMADAGGVPNQGDTTTTAAPLDSVTAVPLSADAVRNFDASWSMVVARLPGGVHELNQPWSDYPDISLAYQWVFEPSKRKAVAERAVQRALGQVSYLQQNGYPQIRVVHIPDYPYVREGPRVMGVTTYTLADILRGSAREVVAIGCYAQYDRHDAFLPTQIDSTAFVRVPMHALMVAGHPWLLVSTAISTDFEAYSSAVRTEIARANVGGAAGIMVVLAAENGVDPTNVPYEKVRALLEQRGYKL